MCKWFYQDWYRYLFEYVGDPRRKRKPEWSTVWCRIKGHPDGPVYYNPGGTEPNGSCKTLTQGRLKRARSPYLRLQHRATRKSGSVVRTPGPCLKDR